MSLTPEPGPWGCPCCPERPAPKRLYLGDYGQPGALVLVHIHSLCPDPQVVRVQGRVHPEERDLAHGAWSLGIKHWSLSELLAGPQDAKLGCFIAGCARAPPSVRAGGGRGGRRAGREEAGREEGGAGGRGWAQGPDAECHALWEDHQDPELAPHPTLPCPLRPWPRSADPGLPPDPQAASLTLRAPLPLLGRCSGLRPWPFLLLGGTGVFLSV